MNPVRMFLKLLEACADRFLGPAEEFEFKGSTEPPPTTCRDCNSELGTKHADWCIWAPGFVRLRDLVECR